MVEHQPSKLDTWVRFPSPALAGLSIFGQAKKDRLRAWQIQMCVSIAQLDRATAF